MASKGADAITTIQLRKATRDRLKDFGAKGETYDDILNRMMDGGAGRARSAGPPERAAERVHARRSKGVVDFEPVD